MTAYGSKRLAKTTVLTALEWLLSAKADVRYLGSEAYLAERRLSTPKLPVADIGLRCLLLTQISRSTGLLP